MSDILYINEYSFVLFCVIQGEDAGSYMCVATNDAGVVERSVTLTLQSKILLFDLPMSGKLILLYLG